jgi:DNA polymerase elongation subunit (family B)
MKNLAIIENNHITIDEDQLNLFDYYDEPIAPWQPDKEIPPYESLSILGVDIETLGLDPELDRIVLIGLYNEKGEQRIIQEEDEAYMLRRFIKILENKKPDILTGFNCIEFDIKFIIHRCRLHGIKHPFSIAKKETVIRTAQRFGEPTRYYAVWVSWGYNHPKETAIIDLYHQVLKWDFVKRKLTSYSLKQSVLQMGLRKEARLELSYSEMLGCWRRRESGGMDRLREYLGYDLEDTKLLGDFLLPSVYYQRLFLDWKLQSLSTSGNGSKINDILSKQYHGFMPVSQPKHTSEGGLTGAIAGFFINMVKLDVISLYPHIMLLYGITSSKDPQKKLLSILKYMKDERIRRKNIANDDTDKYTASEKAFADQMQGTMKIFINSKYGFLSTQGISYNDYVAAAMVTAYGRAILKLMVKTVESYGGVSVSIDTDGIYVHVEPGKEKELYKYVQSAMPKGIELEFELHAKAFYSPPASMKVQTDDDEDMEGLRKNYIIFYYPKKDGSPGGYKATGKFRKRDKSVLEKTFTPEYLLRYMESPESAESYYEEILGSLRDRVYPLKDICITRKIRANEKKLVEQGVGQPKEQVTLVRVADRVLYGKRGKPLKNLEPVWRRLNDSGVIMDVDGETELTYNPQPYIKMIEEQYTEIRYCLGRMEREQMRIEKELVTEDLEA